MAKPTGDRRRSGSSGKPSRRPSGRGGGPRGRPADPARRAAFDVLTAVTERDAYANLVSSSILAERELTGRDAAFAIELAHGTLRRYGGYDRILAGLVSRPLERLDPAVRNVLRLGAHQLLGMRVPAHAAVATSVQLIRDVSGPGPAGMVNAVLRRVGERDLSAWLTDLAPAYADDPVGNLATMNFHPRWVVRAFADALAARPVGPGTESEQLERLLRADNERPAVTLAAWPGRSDVAELGGEPGAWSPYARVLSEGDPGAIGAVAEGRAGVQDEGSQLVALALANAPLADRDRRWLDMCAGPGGKSALLAGVAAEREARLLAGERQPQRARLVARTLRGAAGVLGTLCADGTRPPWRDGIFDRVLVDAPCTGLGALRRRPEARWRRDPSDLDRLRPLQVSLLRSGLRSLRPGGVLAYVTCSPHPTETREVVDEVLGDRSVGARLEDARPALPGVADLGDGPDVQLWPHLHGTDAMYLALIRRV